MVARLEAGMGALNQNVVFSLQDGTWGNLQFVIPNAMPGLSVDFENLPDQSAEFKEDFNNDLQLMTGEHHAKKHISHKSNNQGITEERFFKKQEYI